MIFCCVPGCDNKSPSSSSSSSILNDLITFHRLPLNNKDLLKIWIYNLNLETIEFIKNNTKIRVCSQHFHSQSFRQNKFKRCLIPGSIPYKFIDDSSLLSVKNSLFKIENMVHFCIVNGCKYRKKKNYNRGIMFHSFPVERERLIKWIECINKACEKEININSKSKICQLHFLPDDYNYDDAIQTNVLKSNAIPSVFLINNNKIKSSSSSTIPLQQNTNVLNSYSQQQQQASSSSSSPSSLYYEYNNNQLEIASDTNDDEDENSDDDDSDDEILDVELNESDANNTIPNKNEDLLNTSSSRSNSATKKRSGLSDVIHKLQSKQQQSSSSSLSSLLNNNLENNEPNKQQESPQSATISSVINAVNSLSSISNNKSSKLQQQPLTSISNKIVINQTNKSEIDLYRLLERANLIQYFNSFTEKGGDDINQLCEADEEEFKEICELVGMESKPLHVKRLRKALDEYKNTKSECSNDSFDNHQSLSSLPKCNLNSPNGPNSTYDSAISTNSSSNSLVPQLNYSINQQLALQQQRRIHQQQQQQQLFQIPQQLTFQQQNDSNGLIISSSSSSSIHHQSFDDDQEDNKREMTNDESNDSTSCTSDDDDGGDTSSSIYVNNTNTDTSLNTDTSFTYKPTGNSEQNEKNVKKSKVVELYTQGERCVRKLSQQTGVPLTTVYRVIGKLKGINYNIPRGNGAGRKTILDTQDREILVQILNNNPRISRKALGKELEKRTGKSIHNSTLNRELCRLRHQGTVYPTPGSAQLDTTTQSPNPQIKQEPQTTATPHIKQQQRKQLAIETNNSTIPQLSSSSSSSTTSSSSSSYMAKDLISSTKTSKDQESSSNLLTSSAAMIAAAAAAAFGYPQSSSQRLPVIQSPFSNINAAALAAYSSFFTANNDLTAQSVDADLMKQIGFEVRKLSESTLNNNLEALPLTNVKPEIAAQIMDLINSGLSNDKQTREDTIRKLAGFLLQRPALDKTNYYENCLNEAIIQLCVLKPVLLTRRDDLTNYGKQILDTIGIVENGKRLSTNGIENKRIKIENNYLNENMYALSVYSNLLHQQQQQQQQILQQQQQQQPQQTVPSPTPSSSKLWSAREERLETLKIEIQESVRIQESLRGNLVGLAKIGDSLEQKSALYITQVQLSEELKKYSQLVEEEKRVEKQLKRKRPQKKTKKQQDEEDDTNKTTTGDEENINVDEYDEDNTQQS